jgi:hypothetical protein
MAWSCWPASVHALLSSPFLVQILDPVQPKRPAMVLLSGLATILARVGIVLMAAVGAASAPGPEGLR